MAAVSVTVNTTAVAGRITAPQRYPGPHPWTLWYIIIHKGELRWQTAFKLLIS